MAHATARWMLHSSSCQEGLGLFLAPGYGCVTAAYRRCNMFLDHLCCPHWLEGTGCALYSDTTWKEPVIAKWGRDALSTKGQSQDSFAKQCNLIKAHDFSTIIPLDLISKAEFKLAFTRSQRQLSTLLCGNRERGNGELVQTGVTGLPLGFCCSWSTLCQRTHLPERVRRQFGRKSLFS